VSSIRPSFAPPVELRVLVASAAEDMQAVAKAALEPTGDKVVVAKDMAAAVQIPPDTLDIAFVDVTLPGGMALAIVNHLVGGACAVFAVAPVNQLAQAAEAQSLGAKGIVVAPLTGDALLQSVSEVRADRAVRERMAALEASRDSLAEQVDLMTRAVRVARSGDVRTTAETIAGLVAVATGARGVSVFGPEDRDRVRRRLAAFGTSMDLREQYGDAELADIAAARSASLHQLTAEDRPLGCVVVERARPNTTPRLLEVIEFSSTILSLTQSARAALEDLPTMPRSRGLPIATFERLLEREVEAATRAERGFCLFCVMPDPGSTVDLARLSGPLNEPGSICGVGASGEAFVLLGKTSMNQARALLRTIPFRSIGLVGFPVDGHRSNRLMRLAETRAKEAWRSPVIAHGLLPLSLGEIVRTLIEAPVLDSRLSSVFPLEIAPAQALSLAEHACRQAVRGAPPEKNGFASAHVGGTGALDLPKVARDALGTARVTTHPIARAPDCEKLEIIVVLSELGTWSMCGQMEGGRLRAVHSSDALLAAVLSDRLERVAQLSKPPTRKADA